MMSVKLTKENYVDVRNLPNWQHNCLVFAINVFTRGFVNNIYPSDTVSIPLDIEAKFITNLVLSL
jgi:hypothetical protein